MEPDSILILCQTLLAIKIVGDWESCDPRVCGHSQMQVAFIPPWSSLLSNWSSLQGVCMLFTCLHQGGGISPPLRRMDAMEVLFLLFPMLLWRFLCNFIDPFSYEHLRCSDGSNHERIVQGMWVDGFP